MGKEVMRHIKHQEISEYVGPSDDMFFQYDNNYIRTYGHYNEKVSVINIEEWINAANEIVDRSNDDKGPWKMSGLAAIPEDEQQATLEDWHTEIISTAMEKCQKKLKRI